MKSRLPTISRILLLALAGAWYLSGQAEEKPLGASLDSLLIYARERNPEFASMRLEADAAGERVVPAGALPDPKLSMELRDLTRMGAQEATLAPGRVGSTRYLVVQEVPWFGKRDLKREIAELEADGARGKATGNWSEIAARIKTLHARRYFLERNTRLTNEILDLMLRLEKVAQARYAGGLAAQQDVIRAQVEQTGMRNELLVLASEQRQADARLNALLGRGANAPLVAARQLRALPPPAKLDFAALEERARTRNPLLFAEESRLKAAAKNRELVYKNRYPDFSIGVSPIQVGKAVREWELMLEINLPLQQGTRRAQEREAEAMLAAAEAKKEATANQVLADLAENLAGIEAASQSERLAGTRLLPQAELTFQAALTGYQNGKVDFATLLEAERQIRLAKQNQIKAEAEAQIRLAEIEKLLGEEL